MLFLSYLVSKVKYMDVEKLIDDMRIEVENKLQEKISMLNATEGVFAYIENGSIKIKFDKEIAEDTTQDIAGVILKGGAILTKEGQEKQKNGIKVTEKDFYFLNPIGDKL